MARFCDYEPGYGDKRADRIVAWTVNGSTVKVVVSEEVLDALVELQRETWREERREARHTLSLDSIESFAAVAVDASSSETILLQRLDASTLVSELHRLTPMQLRRFLMHSAVQLTISEIASIEGCSERAVKYTLSKARRRLKIALSDLCSWK